MKIKHNFTVNDRDHVVLSDGIELGMNKEEYMFTQLLQNYDLEILLAIDEFCKKHDITYYLAEGTLLGAVRHKGYIPWDDDIDVCMPRDDYERFLKLAVEEGLPEGFAIDCPATNPNHWTILAQVEMTKPVPYLKKRLEGIALHNGPVVDIFPLDFVDSDYNRKLQNRSTEIRVLRRTMWIKAGLHTTNQYKKLSKRMKIYYPLKAYGKTKTLEQLRRRVFGLMQKTNDNPDNGYIVNFASLYSVDKEVFPREWFGEPKMMEFEGYMFPCPAEPRKVLKKIYSNYHALPLIKKRASKHQFSIDEELLAQIEDQEVTKIVQDLQNDMNDVDVLEEDIVKPSFIQKQTKRMIRDSKRFGRRRLNDVRGHFIDNLYKQPINDRAVLFDAFSGLGILDSPRAIFKRMLEREEFKNFQFIWAISNEKIIGINIDEFASLPNVTIIDRKSNDYIRYLFTAKYIISNSSVPQYYARRKGQVYLNTWHGVPTKVMGYERPGQSILSTRNVVHNFLNATHIVSANDFTANVMYKRAYKLDGIYEGKLLDSPLPRTDAIYNTSRDYAFAKLRAAGIQTTKKIIIYAPTWKGASYKDFDASTEELREAIRTLKENIDTDEYDVFLRVHYFLYRAIDADKELKKICIPFTIDTNELLSITDVMISDYSSIFFDFLGTRKPILFYVPDIEDYVENRGLYVPVEDLPGPVCRDIEEIAHHINNLDKVKEDYADKYETMYQWCSSKEDGHATDRIIDAVFLNKPMPTIDCHTDKKKLLIMVEWGREFAARNELEKMLNELDYNKYDVTLLAGSPIASAMKETLQELNSNVRVLINNRFTNTKYTVRRRVFKELGKGTISLEKAILLLDMSREWQRVVGDAKFDELVLFQSTNKAKQLWFLLAYYAPVKKKSFITASTGLVGVYSHENYMEEFNVYHSVKRYKKSLK